jgi:hypothetical protein
MFAISFLRKSISTKKGELFMGDVFMLFLKERRLKKSAAFWCFELEGCHIR